MRPLPRPVTRVMRQVLLGAGFLVLAVAGAVVGAVADAHKLSGLSHVGDIVFSVALVLAAGFLGSAYFIGVSVPSLARRMTPMIQAMKAGQPVSGSFWAGLREPAPTSPRRRDGSWFGSEDDSPLPGQQLQIARWLTGTVEITPASVIWRRTGGRVCDLTEAQCIGERPPEPAYTEMSLTRPRVYQGEPLKVITLSLNGTNVELATQVQLIEVLRYSLARIPSTHGSDTDQLAESGEPS